MDGTTKTKYHKRMLHIEERFHDPAHGMLGPYRVLDLSDEKGGLCGKILADLGAEVIKVELPGGDPSRRIPPFYHDFPTQKNSLHWAFCNRGKKSITLNLESRPGRELFKKLVVTSHFVVESFPPGYLEGLGLDYEVLKHARPDVIMTAITPYGQSGAYRDYAATDITLMAMGGFMYITGEPGRAPLRISVPQAYFLAGSQAAAATLTAHLHRRITSEGQYIDVSVQACIFSLLANVVPIWELSRMNLKRVGSFLSGRGSAGTKQRLIYQAKDGPILYVVLGGRIGAPSNRAVVQWMSEEGQADDFIRNWKWEEYDFAVTTPEVQERLEGYFCRFFAAHTKAEIYRQGLERHFMVAPVSSPADILANEQLKERGFWQEVHHPDRDTTFTYPGSFYESSEVPSANLPPPPRIGEHNAKIYCDELKMSAAELNGLKKAGVI